MSAYREALSKITDKAERSRFGHTKRGKQLIAEDTKATAIAMQTMFIEMHLFEAVQAINKVFYKQEELLRNRKQG